MQNCFPLDTVSNKESRSKIKEKGYCHIEINDVRPEMAYNASTAFLIYLYETH